MKKLILITFLSCLALALKASNGVLVLDETDHQTYVNAELKVAIQGTKEYTIQEIIQKNPLHFAYKPENKMFNFGFSSQTY